MRKLKKPITIGRVVPADSSSSSSGYSSSSDDSDDENWIHDQRWNLRLVGRHPSEVEREQALQYLGKSASADLRETAASTDHDSA